jgi:putative oxidoreductase
MDLATNLWTSEAARLDVALLLLRCASGPAFLHHGSAILFGWFGGPGPGTFAASHHWTPLLAYLVGAAQVGGGLAILSGIFCRVGSASVSVVMAGAILLVHLRNGFNVVNGGAEYALAQLLIAGALLLLGAGRCSLAFLTPYWIRRL